MKRRCRNGSAADRHHVKAGLARDTSKHCLRGGALPFMGRSSGE